MKTLSLTELLDALNRCATLTGEREFVVVGSQALLGSFPNSPKALRTSQDIDLFAKSGATAEVTKRIYAAYGPESEFEKQAGFYIEPVGEWTMMTSLPGWEDRLVKVDADGGAIGWCISPLDIAYNKAEAGREKDISYLAELFRCGIIRPSTIKDAMDKTGIAADVAAPIHARIQEAIRRASADK